MKLNKVYMLTLSLLAFSLKAQYFEDDARLWMNLNITGNISGKVEGQVLVQNRLNNNFSVYNGYVCLSAAYRFTKKFKVLAGYVLGATDLDDRSYTPIQQSFAGIMYRQKKGRFSFVYRNMIQSQLRGFSAAEYGSTLRLFDRNKFTLKYEIVKRIQVYAATEVYITLLDKARYDQVGRMRYVFGLNYKLSRHQVLEPYFLFQRNYVLKGAPSRAFIYGITYNLEF